MCITTSTPESSCIYSAIFRDFDGSRYWILIPTNDIGKEERKQMYPSHQYIFPRSFHHLQSFKASSFRSQASLFKVPPKATFSKLKAEEPVTARMSKSDIQSWISSSNVDDGLQQENVWQRDRVPTDWPVAMEHAQMVLLNGKTKARIEFLRNDISWLAKHAG